METFPVVLCPLSQGWVGAALCADLEGGFHSSGFVVWLFFQNVGDQSKMAACSMQVLRDWNLRYCKHASASTLP